MLHVFHHEARDIEKGDLLQAKSKNKKPPDFAGGFDYREVLKSLICDGGA
jgi:hypothetical protein